MKKRESNRISKRKSSYHLEIGVLKLILKNRIYQKDLGHLEVNSNTANIVSTASKSKIMQTLFIKCDCRLLHKIGEFSLSEKQIKNFTGLS